MAMKTVFRIHDRKFKSLDELARYCDYLERTHGSKYADPLRKDLNIRLRGSGDLAHDVEDMLGTITRKIKHSEIDPNQNAVLAFEAISTASPAFWRTGAPADFERWQQLNDASIDELYGLHNVAASYLHLDQTTPNVHYIVVPRLGEHLERLSAHEMIGGHKDDAKIKCAHAQDVFGRKMAEVGLERGEVGSTARHNPLSHYRIEQARARGDYKTLGQLARSVPMTDILQEMGARQSKSDAYNWYIPTSPDPEREGWHTKHLIGLERGGNAWIDRAFPNAVEKSVSGVGSIDLVVYLNSCTPREAIDHILEHHQTALSEEQVPSVIAERVAAAIGQRPQLTAEQKAVTLDFGTPNEYQRPSLVLVERHQDAAAYAGMQAGTRAWGTIIALDGAPLPTDRINQALAEKAPRWQIKASFSRDDPGNWQDLQDLYPKETDERASVQRIRRETPKGNSWADDLSHKKSMQAEQTKQNQQQQDMEQAMDISAMLGG